MFAGRLEGLAFKKLRQLLSLSLAVSIRTLSFCGDNWAILPCNLLTWDIIFVHHLLLGDAYAAAQVGSLATTTLSCFPAFSVYA